jgi:hypothetical protein
MPSPKTQHLTCVVCLKIYPVTKQDVERGRRFCRRECRAAWQTGRPRADRGSQKIVKVCRFCKETFEAGGRDPQGNRLPSKCQTYCSTLCTGRARVHHGSLCKEIVPDYIVYIAQFFDGEGSGFITENGRSKTLLPVISIGNTKRAVLEYIAAAAGVGSIVPRRPGSPRQAPVYQWKCTSAAAMGFLRQIWPFLQIKQPIADLLLTAWDQMQADPKLRYDSKWRTELLGASAALNERGPRGSALRADLKRRDPNLRASLPALTEDARQPYRVQNRLGINPALQARDPAPLDPSRPGYRVCPVCAREFLPSANPGPKRPGKTCCTPCSYRHRIRTTTPCLALPVAARKAIASLIESEGTIRVKRISATVHAEVSFGNTDRYVVEWLVAATGLGVVSTRTPAASTHSVFYSWLCRAQGAQGLLEQILPYLKIKRRQALLALYVQERRLHAPSRYGDRGWQDEALALSRSLNARGPHPECPATALGSGLIVI